MTTLVGSGNLETFLLSLNLRNAGIKETELKKDIMEGHTVS